MVTIEVFSEGIRFPHKGISKKIITDIARAAAGHLMLGDALITVVISDNAYISAINKKYRDHDAPTDVLSFSNRENPFPTVDAACEEIGDIYISIERADSQAKEYRVTLADEMKRLIIHGILHLVGYDHERSDEDEALMFQKEEELCTAIKV